MELFFNTIRYRLITSLLILSLITSCAGHGKNTKGMLELKEDIPTKNLSKLDSLNVKIPFDEKYKLTGKMLVLTPDVYNFSHDGQKVYYNGFPLQGSDAGEKVNVLKVLYKRYSIPMDAMMSGLPPQRFQIVLYIANNGNLYCDANKMEGADPDDFAVLFDLYTYSNGQVYLREKELMDADATKFHQIAKDKDYDFVYTGDEKNVYFKGEKIKDVDAASFEIIEYSNFSKDRERVYYKGKVLRDFDGGSFNRLDNSCYLKDKQHVYMMCNPDTCSNPKVVSGEVLDCNGQIYYFLNKAAYEAMLYSKSPQRSIYGYNIWQEPDALKKIDADPASFELIENSGYDYVKDKSNVFYNGNLILGADPTSFRLLHVDSYYFDYAVDRSHVYYKGSILVNADPETFHVMPNFKDYWNYCKDKNRIYHNDKVVEGITPVDFDISCYYFKKGNKVWLRIPGSEVFEFRMTQADPATFVTFEDSDFSYPCPYAKDKKHAYYRGIPIPGADLVTFQAYLDSGYAWDKSRLYFNGKMINLSETFNSSGFKILGYLQPDYLTDGNIRNVYAADATHVYYNDRILEGCDPASVSIRKDDYNSNIDIYAYSKEKVYCRGKLIPGVDRYSLRPELYIDEVSPYSSDGKYIYWENKVIANQNERLEAMPSGYARIGNYIFYEGIEIKGADSKTFNSERDGTYAMDKKSAYFRTIKMPYVDLSSFEVHNYGYASDKNRVYYNGQPIIADDIDTFRSGFSGGRAFYSNDKYIYYYGKKYKIPKR